jgi:hypothetical protein
VRVRLRERYVHGTHGAGISGRSMWKFECVHFGRERLGMHQRLRLIQRPLRESDGGGCALGWFLSVDGAKRPSALEPDHGLGDDRPRVRRESDGQPRWMHRESGLRRRAALDVRAGGVRLSTRRSDLPIGISAPIRLLRKRDRHSQLHLRLRLRRPDGGDVHAQQRVGVCDVGELFVAGQCFDDIEPVQHESRRDRAQCHGKRHAFRRSMCSDGNRDRGGLGDARHSDDGVLHPVEATHALGVRVLFAFLISRP